MTSIAQQIQAISNDLTATAKLVAVSKTKPNEAVLEAYQAGQRVFGENKVQELVAKYEALPKDIEWHMIGHLQTNKVKYIAPFVHLIHGVDSEKLLKEINKQAAKVDRIQPVLLQMHIAQEETKFGLNTEELNAIVEHVNQGMYPNIQVSGLMGMATNTENQTQIAQEFKALQALFTELKNTHFKNNANFKELSIGMSNDYKIALEYGATLIRVGSSIFGARNYTI